MSWIPDHNKGQTKAFYIYREMQVKPKGKDSDTKECKWPIGGREEQKRTAWPKLK